MNLTSYTIPAQHMPRGIVQDSQWYMGLSHILPASNDHLGNERPQVLSSQAWEK